MPDQPNIQIPNKIRDTASTVNRLMIVMIVLTILGLSAASLLLYQNLSLKKQLTSLKSASPSLSQPQISPSPTTGPTASWKTYTNIRKNYQVSYPKDWTVTEDTFIRQSDGLRQDIVTIDSNGRSPRIELDSNNKLSHKESDIKNKKQSNIKIDGLVTYHDVDNDGGGGTFNNYYFIKNNQIYTIITSSYPTDGAGDESEIKQLFDQILSTFRFIGNSPTPKPNITSLLYRLPSGWKTVSDIGSRFSIGYDPAGYNPFPYRSRIDLNSKQCCASLFLKLLPYDGGSRHTFISKNSGAVKIASATEKEYLIGGKSSLFLYGADASGSNTIGMIAFSQNQALLIESQMSSAAVVEQVLSTIQVIKGLTLVPADWQTPTAGICTPAATGSTVTITFSIDNLPIPRCTRVAPDQKLRFINNSQKSLDITVGEIRKIISPTQEYQFPETAGTFLAPGGHTIAGAEIWLE